MIRRRICRRCAGTGLINEGRHGRQCAWCNGEGEVALPQAPVPSGVVGNGWLEALGMEEPDENSPLDPDFALGCINLDAPIPFELVDG